MPPAADTTFVIPWWADVDCPHRKRALGLVLHELGALRENARRFRIGEYRGDTWSKGRAVMPAVEAAPAGDIIVVHDADVLVAGTGLDGAIEAVRSGEYDFARPHELIHRLSPEATTHVLAQGMERVPLLDVDERPYRGVLGGGVFVARRETILDCPLDPRFEGWGQEDESWGVAMMIEHPGAGWFGDSRLLHFWHPPQERMSRARGSQGSWALRKRYFNARHEPGAMRRLLQEAQDALAASHADSDRHP